MTASTTLPYQKTIVPSFSEGTWEYDGYINGSYVGTFPREDIAQAELDRVAIEDARHSGALAWSNGGIIEQTDDLPAANPLVPFGVDGGPASDLTALTPAAVARAAEALADFYERHSAVVSRILSAYDLALLALTDPRPIDARTVVVRENGDLTVRGSKTYWISSHGCTCPDYRHLVYGQKYAGSGAEGGLCKHTLCREILRLAQARQGVFDAESGNKTAFSVVGVAQLARAIHALLKDAPEVLTIEVAFARVRIRAGERVKELKGSDSQGWGIRTLTVSVTDAAALAQALAAFAKEHCTAAVTLMLDAGEQELAVFESGFHHAIQAIA